MRYLVLGGGISGLSAAWYLRKKDPKAQITLLEKGPQLGGWIQTERWGSFLFEKGPRTFQASRCPNLLQLIDELGLKDELLFSDPKAATRYLWYRGKLRSVGSIVPRFISALIRELFVPRAQKEEETIYEFAARRFGTNAAEVLFDPLTLGIYGGDIRKLSLSACFPFLAEAEKKSGSVVRHLFARKKGGPHGLFTLKSGMGTLIEALAKMPVDIVLNTPVESVSEKEVFAGGRSWSADRVICALPASALSPLFGVEIPTRSLSVVHLIYESQLLKKRGFGYLVPSQEKESILGMIWDSSVFARGTGTQLTAMIRPESKEPLQEAFSALQRHLGVFATPIHTFCYSAQNAIPQFEMGHKKKLDLLLKKTKGIHLVGNYFEGASVEAAINRSKTVDL